MYIFVSHISLEDVYCSSRQIHLGKHFQTTNLIHSATINMYQSNRLAVVSISALLVALLLIVCRECRGASLTDAFDSDEDPARRDASKRIIHWVEIGFSKDVVAAEIKRMVEESNLDALRGDSSQNFGSIPELNSRQQEHRSGILARLGEAVKATLAPISEYMNIARRYQRWLAQYKQLEEKTSSRDGMIKPALDVLREEYAKADELLKKEFAETNCYASSINGKANSIENETETVDFIFLVLKKLIDRLEWRLDAEREHYGYKMFVEAPYEGFTDLPDDETRVHEAMGKVKQVVTKAVSMQLIKESVRVTRIALLNMLATAMSNNYYPENSIRNYISNIVLLLGSVENSVAVSYLRELKFRAALVAVSYVNMKPHYDCNDKKSKS